MICHEKKLEEEKFIKPNKEKITDSGLDSIEINDLTLEKKLYQKLRNGLFLCKICQLKPICFSCWEKDACMCTFCKQGTELIHNDFERKEEEMDDGERYGADIPFLEKIINLGVSNNTIMSIFDLLMHANQYVKSNSFNSNGSIMRELRFRGVRLNLLTDLIFPPDCIKIRWLKPLKRVVNLWLESLRVSDLGEQLSIKWMSSLLGSKFCIKMVDLMRLSHPKKCDKKFVSLAFKKVNIQKEEFDSNENFDLIVFEQYLKECKIKEILESEMFIQLDSEKKGKACTIILQRVHHRNVIPFEQYVQIYYHLPFFALIQNVRSEAGRLNEEEFLHFIHIVIEKMSSLSSLKNIKRLLVSVYGIFHAKTDMTLLRTKGLRENLINGAMRIVYGSYEKVVPVDLNSKHFYFKDESKMSVTGVSGILNMNDVKNICANEVCKIMTREMGKLYNLDRQKNLSSQQKKRMESQVDLFMFMIDGTASMDNGFRLACKICKCVLEKIKFSDEKIEAGLVIYRDVGCRESDITAIREFVTKVIRPTTNFDLITEALTKQYAEGGQDIYEDMINGFQNVYRVSEEAQKVYRQKNLIIIRDAPGHGQRIAEDISVMDNYRHNDGKIIDEDWTYDDAASYLSDWVIHDVYRENYLDYRHVFYGASEKKLEQLRYTHQRVEEFSLTDNEINSQILNNFNCEISLGEIESILDHFEDGSTIYFHCLQPSRIKDVLINILMKKTGIQDEMIDTKRIQMNHLFEKNIRFVNYGQTEELKDVNVINCLNGTPPRIWIK